MIYLDNAATTLRKPPNVLQSVMYALKHTTSPGRGGYSTSEKAEEILFACRSLAAELFDVDNPEQVIFTFNATHALNIAIKSMVKPGDNVLISGFEHNAVTRTLHGIKDVTVTVFRAPLFDDEGLLEDFKQKIAAKPTVVICTHVSNVFGNILPMDQIAQICRQREVPLIVDASQSAGCIPVTMGMWGAAFVAMPGHKGLYGPQGTGLLLCGHDALPLMEGGTGSESKIQQMPGFLPDRLEAGTHNVPGISGLLAGLQYVRKTGTDRIRRKEANLLEMVVTRLQHCRGLELFAKPERRNRQSGVLSFRIKDMDCHRAGEWLAKNGIAVRSGLHCAPLAHQSVGTLETGTVRASFSAMTTQYDAEMLCAKLECICTMK